MTETKTDTPAAEPKDQLSITQHTFTSGGQTIHYTVTAGTIVLKEESEKKKGDEAGQAEGEKARATIFFIAYTRDDVADKTRRPLTFSFNGGPGSSSVWLHLGAARPAPGGDGRSRQPAAAALPPGGQRALAARPDRPGVYRPGEHRLQPRRGGREGQGLSQLQERHRVGGRLHPPVCHALRALDLAQVPDRRELWHHPRRRAVRLSAGAPRPVPQRHHAGLVDPQFPDGQLRPRQRPAVHLVPAHLYRHRLVSPSAWRPSCRRTCQAALREAEAFALRRLRPGADAGRGAARRAARRRSPRGWRATPGCRPTTSSARDLRIEIFRFTKELLRDERRTVGRLDSRFKGIDRDAAGERPEFDPSYANIQGPYTAAFNDYVRGELKYESDLPYEILTDRVSARGAMAPHENQYVNVAETLRKAMLDQPALEGLRGQRLLRSGYAVFRDPVHAQPPGAGPEPAAATSRWAIMRPGT